jgi:DnaD/phage-associated family protein
MNNFTTGHDVVDAIGQMHLEGNIIPHAWYETLRLKSGKPDMVAMILLSEFVYWYRPSFNRDEETGQMVGAKKKFKADLLQKSYPDLAEQFGFSAKQIREALIRLEEKGVLERVFRTVNTKKGKIPNVMFIKLDVSGLGKICFPTGKDVFPSKETHTSLQGKTNTDITTKSSTDINLVSSSKGISEIIQFWDNSGFGFNNNHAKDQLLAYLDDGFDPEVILKALHIASEVDKRTLQYIKGILHKWENAGAKNIQQVNAYMEQYKSNNQKGGKSNERTKPSDNKSDGQAGSKYSL